MSITSQKLFLFGQESVVLLQSFLIVLLQVLIVRVIIPFNKSRTKGRWSRAVIKGHDFNQNITFVPSDFWLDFTFNPSDISLHFHL